MKPSHLEKTIDRSLAKDHAGRVNTAVGVFVVFFTAIAVLGAAAAAINLWLS